MNILKNKSISNFLSYMRLSRPLVGLDIQPQTLRLAILRKDRTGKNGNGYQVEQAGCITLPDGVFADGRVRQWNVFGAALQELVQQTGAAGNAASVVLPVSLVRVQHMQLPIGMSSAAIHTEINQQIERDFPGMQHELCVDFSVSEQNETGYADIFFAVAKQEYIAQLMSAIEEAGLQLKIIDLDVYVLKRVFEVLFPVRQDSNGMNVMVCLAGNTGWLIIFNQKEIAFHQQYAVIERLNFVKQIQKQIMHFFAHAIVAKHGKLAVFGVDFADNPTNSSIANLEICHATVLSALTMNTQLESQLNAGNISDFMLACGVAMREVPRW